MKLFNCQLSTVNCQLLLLLAAGAILSCNNLEDDYSTDSSLRLSFSVDTLSFDTVFTTVGTATRQFMIYNTNKEALNISSVRLEKGEQSNFRINVDGRSGQTFFDIYILGKDSMYVLVEATVDPTGQDTPLTVEDRVAFTVNGTQQTVLLQAHGQDANMIKGGYVFDKDTVLSAQRPYLIYDSVVIAKGITVTCEPGASFFMHDKARWVVHGTLMAAGTLEAPITFRGDRLDDLIPDVPFDRMPGQWYGMHFKAESFGNVMDNVSIRNTAAGVAFDESTTDESKLIITNSQITNSSGNLFTADNCHIEAVNTEFTNAKGQLVALNGGTYHFIHCTLANRYIFDIRTGDPALTLSGSLAEATFDNCIIDGNYSEGSSELGGEISIGSSSENVLFNHCAVKTKQTSDERFVGVQFVNNDYDLQYKAAPNKYNDYLNDFRLDLSTDYSGNTLDDQPAIGKADKSIADQYPTDRYGINRTTSEDGPDIGASEYVEEEITE